MEHGARGILHPVALGQGAGTFAGALREVAVPTPPAGTEWTAVVPGGVYWRIRMATAHLVISAAVNQRRPGFDIANPDGLVYLVVDPVFAATAGLAYDIGYAPGVPSSPASGGNIATNTIPDILLPTGWQLRSRTQLMDAGDQYSAVRLLVEEIYLGADGVNPGHGLHRQHDRHPDDGGSYAGRG